MARDIENESDDTIKIECWLKEKGIVTAEHWYVKRDLEYIALFVKTEEDREKFEETYKEYHNQGYRLNYIMVTAKKLISSSS
jgi:hypothetical protein